MKSLVFRYPRNKITDILISLLCIFVIALILQVDDYCSYTEAFSDSSDDRCLFLQTYGWIVDTVTEEKSTFYVPTENSSVFLRYYELQKNQGFELEEFRGLTVEKYTYKVLFTPNGDSSNELFATLLVYNGKIIAADIHSVSLNGYIQGVKR